MPLLPSAGRVTAGRTQIDCVYHSKMKASTSHRLQTVVLTAVLAVLGASGIGASQVHAHPDVDSVFTNGTDVADVASAKVYTTYFIDWG